MSVGRLGRLLESGEYHRCLEEARTLLQDGDHNPEASARIQMAICRSCVELTDYFAASAAGEQAVEWAEQAHAPDLLGAALMDLAAAQAALRRDGEAVHTVRRYLNGLDTYTAAKCLEGTAYSRLGAALRRDGRAAEAKEAYLAARRWFERFGDGASHREAGRSLLRLQLECGDHDSVQALLAEGDAQVAENGDRRALCVHLLDRSLVALVRGRHSESAQAAFAALEVADGRFREQAEAHLLLARNALAQSRAREALAFMLAARVSAIDGKVYDLEFEASHLLFQTLQAQGPEVLSQVRADCLPYNVDILHYLSDRVLHRMFHAH